MKKQLLLFVILIVAAITSKAQLYFQNNTPLAVNVAYALPVDDGNYKGFISHGWVTVQAHEKKMLTPAMGGANRVYYYATNSVRSYGGHSSLLVDTVNSFNITDANYDFGRLGSPYYWRQFIREVVNGPEHTIVLHD